MASTIDGVVSSSASINIDADYRDVGGGAVNEGNFVFCSCVTVGSTIEAINVNSDVNELAL